MDTRHKIIEALKELRPDVEDFESVELIDSGILDSFDMVSLIHELAERFDIEIGIENVLPENFNTVNSIQSMVERLIGEKGR